MLCSPINKRQPYLPTVRLLPARNLSLVSPVRDSENLAYSHSATSMSSSGIQKRGSAATVRVCFTLLVVWYN